MIEYVNDASAPLPRGHYSQAVKANGFIFLSGQLPITPGLEVSVPQGLDAQVTQVFHNLAAVLSASGGSLKDVVSVQIFIVDMRNWPRINELYAQIFAGCSPPARTVVSCPEIHYGAEIEVSVVAIDRAQGHSL